MANKKNYRKRGRRRRPYKPRSRYQNYAGAAKQLWRDVKMIKDMVNVETKIIRTPVSYTPDWNGINNSVCDISLGDSQGTRDGSMVKIQNLNFYGRCQTSPGINAEYRIVVYLDDSASSKLNTDVFSNSLLGTKNAVHAPKLWQNRFKTKFLYDKTYTINPSSATSVNLRDFSFHLPINKHTQYEPSSNVVSSGDIRLAIITDQSSTAASLEGLLELKFTDN